MRHNSYDRLYIKHSYTNNYITSSNSSRRPYLIGEKDDMM